MLRLKEVPWNAFTAFGRARNLFVLCLLLAPILACESVSLDETAQKFESEGHWDQALEAWTRWEPDSFCGTCLDSLYGEREYHLGICLERIGYHTEAKERYWNAMSTLQTEEASECARQLLKLHEATGTTEELREKLSSLSETAQGWKPYEWLIQQLR
jgi:hypothetical protein